MKTNILSKGKWYIFGAIAIVIILSIGLSFCVWDNNSVGNALVGATANFKAGVYILTKDNDNNKAVSIGDIVEFGDYYQDANGEIKTLLEWRVVDIRTENKKEVLYLLTEYAVASGVFFQNGLYFDINNNDIRPGFIYNNCYNDSTVRAWLNSDQFGEARKDGGIGFTNPPANSDKVFYGFYNEAFSESEKNSILARDFTGMSGYSYYINNNQGKVNYPDLKGQKVWLPSVTEILGSNLYNTDNTNDKQFGYYSDNDLSKRTLYSTPFNKVNNGKIISNYTFADMPATPMNVGANNNIEAGKNWTLRSAGSYMGSVGLVRSNTGEIMGSLGCYDSTSAIRPGICLYK